MSALARWVLLPLACGLSGAWAAAALWIDGPASRPAAALLAGGFVAAAVAAFAWLRPLMLAALAHALLFGAVLLWWLSLEPSNDREWLADVARPATVTIDGDRVTVRNVRNFSYRTPEDYDEHWEERTYDLSELKGADIFLSYWGSPWIAHTIVSWDFGGGEHLAISIETRKETGEEYSALLGFFRQFEVYYVVADERDLVGLRTNHRGEDVYLYRFTAPPERVRAILVDYLEEINRLAEQPEWYNAGTHNCTTTIRRHAQHVAAGRPWDWRILVNGAIDQLGYERGTIVTGGLPFEELRARSAISARALAAGPGDDFPERIRAGLPDAGR
jgi:hypothetical protein